MESSLPNDPNYWKLNAEDRVKCVNQFKSLGPAEGLLTGDQVKSFFLQSGLSTQTLGKIWQLSDLTSDGKMNLFEFIIAMVLIRKSLKGFSLPLTVPSFVNQFFMGLSNEDQETSMNQSSESPKQSPQDLNSSSVSSGEWVIPPGQRLKYKSMFNSQDQQRKGYLTGLEAKNLLSQSGLIHSTLAQIWCLADVDKDGNLSSDEFCVAMYLIDQTKSGFVLPTILPFDLIPPSYKKTRRLSEANSCQITTQQPNEIQTNRPSSSAAILNLNQQETKNSTEFNNDLHPQKIITFEDKRKENFDKGQVELEKRREMLRKLQIEETEKRLAAEKAEQEKKEKIKHEQELKKQQELERQLEKQRQAEMEKEELRRKVLEQKQAAKREVEKQRQLEWERQRKDQLELERNKEKDLIEQLRQTTGQQDLQIQSLKSKKKELKEKLEQLKKGHDDTSSTIDSMKLLSLSKSTEIDLINSELEEREMKMVAVEQEILRLEKQKSSMVFMSDEMWEDLKKVRESEKEIYEELVKKIEIVEASCKKKMLQLQSLEEKLKNLQKTNEMSHNLNGQSKENLPHFQSVDSFPNNFLQEKTFSTPSASNSDTSQNNWVADFANNKKETSAFKKYKALYKFVARNSDELTFDGGDEILVLAEKQNNAEPGWMIGIKDGKEGCFPENYVTFIQTLENEKVLEKNLDSKIKTKTNEKPDPTSASYSFKLPAEVDFSAMHSNLTSAFSKKLNEEKKSNEEIQKNIENDSPGELRPIESNSQINLKQEKSPTPPTEESVVPPSSNDVKNPHELDTIKTSPTEQPTKLDNHSVQISKTSKHLSLSPTYQAIYAWHAKKDSHLTLEKGDVVQVSMEKDNWYFGEKNNKTGWFPKSYVKQLPSPATQEKPLHEPDTTSENINNDNLRNNQDDPKATEEFIVVALFPFESKVEGDLSFLQGDVFPAQMTDKEWWTGTINKKTGIFPASYVRRMDSMKPNDEYWKSTSIVISGKLDKRPEIATVIAEYEATGPEQLSFQPGQLVQIKKKSSSGWWEGEIQVKGQKRRIGWFPGNYVKLLTNETSPQDSVQKTKNCNEVFVEALYKYKSLNQEDLIFSEGEKIKLIEKLNNDWWKGELNGQTGLFPANYVRVCTQGSQ